MQLQELNALLAQSDQFAISPTPIDRPIPHGHEVQRGRHGRTCPFGLVKVTVLETSHPWTEPTSFGCVGKTHPVERRTGVLIRVKRADLGDIDPVALVTSSDYAEATIDNENVFQLVVSRKAILMPWTDYQPVRDARRKSKREADRRNARLQAAVSALGADGGHWNSSWDKSRQTQVYKAENATVKLSLPQAEALISKLRERGLIEAEGMAA